MRSSRFLALTVLLSLLVVACAGEAGGDSATTASSAPATVDGVSTTATTAATPSEETEIAPSGGDMPDPCALLTVDDILTATGVPFDAGAFNEELSSDQQVICDWIGSEEFAVVQVLIHDIDSFEGNRDSAEEFLGEVTDVEVPGVSAAFATTEGSVIGMQVDGGYLQVSYVPNGPGTVLEETTQLAAIAAANLG